MIKKKMCKIWANCIDALEYFMFDEIEGYFKSEDFKVFLSE